MKTSRLSLLVLLTLLGSLRAHAFSTFLCLRDMLEVTTHAYLPDARNGFESPFMLDPRYMVFPEIKNKRVSGFYVYSEAGAWYYDAVLQRAQKPTLIRTLGDNEKIVYQLVAQPNGIETITILLDPGSDIGSTNQEGAVVLGSSIMPVMGALVSRPNRARAYYQHPSRKPAAKSEDSKKTIAKLATTNPKSAVEIMLPLNQELALRRNWISSRNLDELTFQKFNRVLQTTCKENSPSPL